VTIADGGIYNGMPASELGEMGWERPWSGTSGGQCVEMKRLTDGRVAVRQSTDPAGPALIYTPEEMGAFVAGVKNGLADHMTVPQPCGSRTAKRRAHRQAPQAARATPSIT
jgi:hypothetical protein